MAFRARKVFGTFEKRAPGWYNIKDKSLQVCTRTCCTSRFLIEIIKANDYVFVMQGPNTISDYERQMAAAVKWHMDSRSECKPV